jgi:hypothetical protein
MNKHVIGYKLVIPNETGKAAEYNFFGSNGADRAIEWTKQDTFLRGLTPGTKVFLVEVAQTTIKEWTIE